jgi:hypothetical protein
MRNKRMPACSLPGRSIAGTGRDNHQAEGRVTTITQIRTRSDCLDRQAAPDGHGERGKHHAW